MSARRSMSTGLRLYPAETLYRRLRAGTGHTRAWDPNSGQKARPRSSRDLQKGEAGWARLGRAGLRTLVAAGCGSRLTTDEGEVRGRVMTTDGKSGVTCYVEINAMPPLFSPESVEVKTGGEFRRVMKTSGLMRNMYAAVRCQ